MEGKDATKLYIPILTVVGMLSGLLIIVWFAATKSTQIEIIEKNQDSMATQLRDTPTRTEYNDLKSSISEVKTAIENLGKEIRAKR